MSTEVFEFHSLSALFQHLQSKIDGRRNSYGSWAKRMGYKSSRLISMVFREQRPPSVDFIQKLGRALKLKSTELRYLELLFDRYRYEQKGQSVPDSIVREMKSLQPLKRQKLKIAELSILSHWSQLVLRQLFKKRAVKHDLDKLHAEFELPLTQGELKQAVNNMIELGYVQYDSADRSLVASLAEGFETPGEIPSAHIREFHRQMLRCAHEAIERQSIFDRHYMALTLCVDPKDIPSIKEKIDAFYESLDKEYSRAEGAIYQCQTQLFRHMKMK